MQAIEQAPPDVAAMRRTFTLERILSGAETDYLSVMGQHLRPGQGHAAAAASAEAQAAGVGVEAAPGPRGQSVPRPSPLGPLPRQPSQPQTTASGDGPTVSADISVY